MATPLFAVVLVCAVVSGMDDDCIRFRDPRPLYNDIDCVLLNTGIITETNKAYKERFGKQKFKLKYSWGCVDGNSYNDPTNVPPYSFEVVFR